MFLKKRARICLCVFVVFFLIPANFSYTTSFFSYIHSGSFVSLEQAPQKPIKIVVIEQPPDGKNSEGIPYDSEDENGVKTLDKTAKNYEDKKAVLGIDHVIRATSVKDMVKKILEALKEDECIGSLTISGHGSPGNISMGSGQNFETGKSINGDMEEWEDELEKLKEKFCPGASVLLKGCNVGSCDKGAEKLQELADVLGVPVEAPTGEAHPDCTYENGSEMQRAEPSPPDSLEHNDPPPCKLSPKDKEKISFEEKYTGQFPFHEEELIGLEFFPVGFPMSIVDHPAVFDASPGDEFFHSFLEGVEYSVPISFEKELLANFNALTVLRFADGSIQQGMFYADYDYFIFPFTYEENISSMMKYKTINYPMELQIKDICDHKKEAWKEATEFHLTATPRCSYIELSWTPVPEASSYYVYRGPGEGMQYPIPLTDFPVFSTTYQDRKDVVPNILYCYFVRAVSSEHQEFLQSNEACAVMTCISEIPPITKEDCMMTLKYQVNNKFYWKNGVQKGPMDVAPIIREQRVNLMARYLAEETGALVAWEAITRTVIITRSDSLEIRMQIGNSIAMVGGVPQQIDPNNSSVVPFIENNRTYTSLRFISYNLGASGPNDIIWRAEDKVVELIFDDPYCKWICGCIRSLSSHPTSANIASFGFFENCRDEKPYSHKIPDVMKDRIFHLTLAEYVRKYPNQSYWCAEIRVDEIGNLIAWRALAGKYHDCCNNGN